MLGESYVTDRQILQEVFDEMLSLSVRTGLALASAELFGPLLDIMRRPFVLAVLGEVNVGKSALINALHGSYLCRVHDLPETKWPMRHRSGDAKSETLIDNRWVDCVHAPNHWPHLEWWDFPGLGQRDKASRGKWDEWLGVSDIIFMVVHQRNPWSAQTWDELSRLDPVQLSRVVIVVQACDEIDASDFPVLSEHVRELTQKRLSRELPVFLVSARLAFQSRELGGDETLWKASGIERLSFWIDEMIKQEATRSAARQTFSHLLHEQLQRIENDLDREKVKILARLKDWERLDREIKQLFRAACQNHAQKLPLLKKEYLLRSEVIVTDFRRMLGLSSSLLGLLMGRRISRQLDQISHEKITEVVSKAVTSEVNWMMKQCEAHWHKELMNRREDRFFTSQSWRDVEELLRPVGQEVCEKMAQVSVQSLGELRIRGTLVGALHERSMGISLWLSVFLGAIILAGFSGAMRLMYVPQIFLGIAAVIWLILVAYGRKTRDESSSIYLERLKACDEEFLTALTVPYENQLAGFFQSYAEAWLPLRLRIAQDDADNEEKRQSLKNAMTCLSRQMRDEAVDL